MAPHTSTSSDSPVAATRPPAHQQSRQPQQPQQQLCMSLNTRIAWRAVGGMAACAVAVLTAAAVLLGSSGLGAARLLALWCAAEAVFAADYYLRRLPHFTSDAVRLLRPEDHDVAATLSALVRELRRVPDVREALASWFRNAAPADIRRGNVAELFSYAVFYRTPQQMEADGLLPQLEGFMQTLERELGWRAPEGHTEGLKFVQHLWEPLQHIYRPLFFYCAMEGLALLCHVGLLAAGFQEHVLGGLNYYTLGDVGPQHVVRAISSQLSTRKRSSASLSALGNTPGDGGDSGGNGGAEAPPPILFLHGVGAGLLPYFTVIFRLASLGQPMILPHFKHVSMRLISAMPTVDDMGEVTAAILAAHGVTQAAVVAHSYGTMVASVLVMQYSQLVQSLCLVDPVVFAMFYPDLVRNFLRIDKARSSGLLLPDFVMWLVSTELHCCCHFSRGFFWTSINLWDHHLPQRTLVAMGGRDVLSPTATLQQWLKEHSHVQVLFHPELPHAGLLLNGDWQQLVLSSFARIMQQPLAPVDAGGSSAGAAAEERPQQQQGEDDCTQQADDEPAAPVAAARVCRKRLTGQQQQQSKAVPTPAYAADAARVDA